MNNNQRFDEHIKTQLDGLEPDVPSHVWDNIVAQRKKKRPLPFWFSLLNNKILLVFLAILITGAGATWFLTKNGTSPSASTASLPDKNIVSPINKNIENKNNTPATNVVIDKNKIDEPKQANGNTAITKNLNSDLQIDKYSRSTAFAKKAPRRSSIKTSGGAIANVTQNEEENNAADLVKKENANISEENIEQEGTIPATGTLYNRLLLGIEKNIRKEKAALTILKRKTSDVFIPKCPVEKDAAGNKKYIETYIAVDYGIRSLSDTGSNSTYLQKRKESTKFSSAFSAGIRYTKVFNNSMSIRAGINFSQISEKFTLAQGNLVQVTYIINANGDTTGSYTTTGTRYKTTYNKYRTIDIPLLIGYEIGNGRFHTNINAGPVINIYSWQRGEVLDVNNQPVNITTGKSNSVYGFKTNAGLGFMGAVSLYYKLTDNLHLMAEPYFKYSFGQMNRTELTIKQKYNTIGLKLGVRLDIP